MLSRGVLHVEYVGEACSGDKVESMELFVQKVRAAVNTRFRGDGKPRIILTDRGGGFYHIPTGYMTDEYKAALAANAFAAFAGEDARIQPGNLQEAMLHETAVAWIRYRLAKTVPPRPWEETEQEYAKRLKECVAYINEHHNVKGLNMEFTQRVARIMAADGGRISK